LRIKRRLISSFGKQTTLVMDLLLTSFYGIAGRLGLLRVTGLVKQIASQKIGRKLSAQLF